MAALGKFIAFIFLYMLPSVTGGTMDRFIINNNKTLQYFFFTDHQYRFIESEIAPKVS
jgi:hypothetical protein